MSSAQLGCTIYHQTVILVLQFFKSLQDSANFSPGVAISVFACVSYLVFSAALILVFSDARLLVFTAKIAKYYYFSNSIAAPIMRRERRKLSKIAFSGVLANKK